MVKMQNSMCIFNFFKIIPDELSANLYLESKRWGEQVCCHHCNSLRVVSCKNRLPMPYRCMDCRRHFSVRTGTILEESRLPLQKWLMAIYLMTTTRKGISSIQMAKELGVTQKTAWFLAQRIREAWSLSISLDGKLDGNVEVDETFIGGKERDKHYNKKYRQGRGGVGKHPIIGAKKRGGSIVAETIENTTASSLHSFISKHITIGSKVYTDSFRGYNRLVGYPHRIVNHLIGEYVSAEAHTNGIESFWALLKRGYYGIYHHMSYKHLHRYIDEFSYRHNTSKIDIMDVINNTIVCTNNKRLTYKELINA